MDSFKGSATSEEVEAWATEGILSACPEAKIECVPLADGGEGTLDAFSEICGGELKVAPVHDPFGKEITARFLLCEAKEPFAIVESAEAAGLQFSDRSLESAMSATSRGVGELILAAQAAGAKKIYVGLGGTCTSDGGIGLLEALNYKAPSAKLVALSDVKNPLCGRDGAVAVFGPQKGIPEEFIAACDERIRTQYEDFAPQVINKPGAGAAGGMGTALLFLGAEMKSGVDVILDAANFDTRLQDADLVIVGEGHMDKQTLSGKAPVGVAKRAMAAEVPVYAIVGSADKSIVMMRNYGINRVFSIVNGRQVTESDLTPEATHRSIKNVAAFAISQFL